MADMIFQPQGTGTTRKEGTAVVGSPKGAYTGTPNSRYVLDTYVSNLPTTGTVNDNYEYKFGNKVETTKIALNGATTGTLVSAVAGRKIEVTSYTLVCSAASTINFLSDSTSISSGMSFAANGGAAVGDGTGPVLTTSLGEALKVSSTSGIVGGHVSYRIL